MEHLSENFFSVFILLPSNDFAAAGNILICLHVRDIGMAWIQMNLSNRNWNACQWRHSVEIHWGEAMWKGWEDEEEVKLINSTNQLKGKFDCNGNCWFWWKGGGWRWFLWWLGGNLSKVWDGKYWEINLTVIF